MSDDGPVLYQGTMCKRAQGKSTFGRMTWKERFFVLTQAEVAYYEGFGGRDNPQSKLKSKIPTEKITAVEEVELKAFKRPYMLQIVYQDGILYCQAQSLKDRTEWFENLRKVIKDNSSLVGEYHPGVYEGKWTCCLQKGKDLQGCTPAFDYSIIGRLGPQTASLPANHDTIKKRNPNDSLPSPLPEASTTSSSAAPPTSSSPPPTTEAAESFDVVAMYSYQQLEPTDLSLEKGERLAIVDATEEHWWKARNASGKEGYIPSNYVRKLGMEAEPWYLGSISKSEASALLHVSGQDGCFLVRESESSPGQYSLSVLYKSKLKHYRIKIEDGKHYVSDRHRFASIADLIEYHKHNSGGLVTRLRKPVNDLNQPSTSLGHDRWELNHEEIELGRELGSGNFGVVREGTYRGNIKVAVKMMKPGTMSEDDFIAEAQVMMKFRHKNLVDLHGVCTAVKPIYIVTELMSNGCLLDYLKQHASTLASQPEILHYMSVQVAGGMKFLESHGFIHRDLAARNCLVGDNNVVKVADFGLARFTLDDEYTASEGTKFPIKWASPEVFSFARFSTKSDVWSYGILLWELWSLGTTPYPDLTNAQTVDKVTRGYRMGKPNLASQQIYEIMTECWHKDADSRLSFAEILSKLEENATGYD